MDELGRRLEQHTKLRDCVRLHLIALVHVQRSRRLGRQVLTAVRQPRADEWAVHRRAGILRRAQQCDHAVVMRLLLAR